MTVPTGTLEQVSASPARAPAPLDMSLSARALKLEMPEHPPRLAEDLANAHFNLSPLPFPGPPPTTSLHHLPRSQLIPPLLHVEGECSRAQHMPRLSQEVNTG